MIDHTTRWPEATSLTSITAESFARAFISTWISRFGVPALITSDFGTQFTSSIWARVCETLKISHSTTTSFHPQSNGMIEHFHRSLKSSLRARLAGQDWVHHLPLVLLGLRTTPKEDSGYAPAEALFGTQLAVPGEFLDAPELPPTDFLRKIDSAITGFSGPVPHHTCPAPARPLPRTLLSSEFVFVREDSSVPPLSQLYRGPYKVVDRKEKYFKLQIGSQEINVSVDRLKPVFSDVKVSPALPPPEADLLDVLRLQLQILRPQLQILRLQLQILGLQ